MKLATLAAGLLIVSATAVSANDGHRWNGWGGGWNSGNRVDNRQHNQADRIENGRRDGSLTTQEYWHLKQEQARIAEMERRAKADGHVSREERRRLEQAQDAASRHIYQERHDGQRRWYNGRWW